MALSLLALAFTIPLAAGRFNIGGEGQLILGAVGAPPLASPSPSSLCRCCSRCSSCPPSWLEPCGPWIAAWLMDRFRVNEILSTVLLNFVSLRDPRLPRLAHLARRGGRRGGHPADRCGRRAAHHRNDRRMHAGVVLVVILRDRPRVPRETQRSRLRAARGWSERAGCCTSTASARRGRGRVDGRRRRARRPRWWHRGRWSPPPDARGNPVQLPPARDHHRPHRPRRRSSHFRSSRSALPCSRSAPARCSASPAPRPSWFSSWRA